MGSGLVSVSLGVRTNTCFGVLCGVVPFTKPMRLLCSTLEQIAVVCNNMKYGRSSRKHKKCGPHLSHET